MIPEENLALAEAVGTPWEKELVAEVRRLRHALERVTHDTSRGVSQVREHPTRLALYARAVLDGTENDPPAQLSEDANE